MKTAVIVFPASNCDRDAATALEKVTGRAPDMVWHRETSLPNHIDFVVIPGGFSYGDYLRSGAIAARSPIVKDLVARAEKRPARSRVLQRVSDPDRNRPPARRAYAQQGAEICLPPAAA